MRRRLSLATRKELIEAVRQHRKHAVRLLGSVLRSPTGGIKTNLEPRSRTPDCRVSIFRGSPGLACKSRFPASYVTFYRPIPPRTSQAWIRKVEKNKRFRFTGKLWHGFTHNRNAGKEDERQFKDGYKPLLEANRLGAILLQFPWSFRNTDENRDYVSRLRSRFDEFPLVLEVRHAGWNTVGVLDWLAGLDMALCNIDQPLFHRSIKPGAEATSAIGYVRLHGRTIRIGSRKTRSPMSVTITSTRPMSLSLGSIASKKSLRK